MKFKLIMASVGIILLGLSCCYIYYVNLKNDNVRVSFPQTRATIISSGFKSDIRKGQTGGTTSRGLTTPIWKLDITYEYFVETRKYIGMVHSNVGDLTFERDTEILPEKLLKITNTELAVGKEIMIYYNPKVPSDSHIINKPREHLLWVVVGGVLFIIIGCGLLIFRNSINT